MKEFDSEELELEELKLGQLELVSGRSCPGDRPSE